MLVEIIVMDQICARVKKAGAKQQQQCDLEQAISVHA